MHSNTQLAAVANHLGVEIDPGGMSADLLLGKILVTIDNIDSPAMNLLREMIASIDMAVQIGDENGGDDCYHLINENHGEWERRFRELERRPRGQEEA